MKNCRIGITTNPKRRKNEWKNKYPNLSGWEILEKHQNKTNAQKAEKKLEQHHGCKAEPGGAGNERDTWYVYKFNF